LRSSPHRLTVLRLVALLALLWAAGGASPAAAAPRKPAVSAETARKRLADGNARFVAGRSARLRSYSARRTETTKAGQHPFATVLACSDSRVPPELLFDQGLGDVFVVRVAGNVVATDEAGSIEYGVDHLETPLLVVLGHTHCGAVTAVAQGAELHGSIPALVAPIRPAVALSKRMNPALTPEALVPVAIRNNVFQAIEDLLRRSPAARERVAAGTLQVVGAIESGAVEWLGEHPDQPRLLATRPVSGDRPPTPGAHH